jgi:hypothetical protein
MAQQSAPIEARCTLLICPDDAKNAHTEVAQIIKMLEEGSDEEKRSAVKTSILLLLQGEQIDGLLMTIIRYCINTKDHELRKLLHLYWEVRPRIARAPSRCAPKFAAPAPARVLVLFASLTPLPPPPPAPPPPLARTRNPSLSSTFARAPLGR